MQDRLDKIVKVINDDEILLSYIPGDTNKAIVIFTDHSNRREQFVRYAMGDHTYIFICDKNDSWGNRMDVDKILPFVKDLIKDKTVYAVGNSMGGNMAMTFAELFNISYSLSFVPQYSIRYDIIKNDYLDCDERLIQNWRFPYVTFNDHTKYTIITTNGGHDLYHVDLFKQHAKENVSMFLFDEAKGFHHAVVAQLRDMGILESIFKDFLDCGEISNGTYEMIKPHLV